MNLVLIISALVLNVVLGVNANLKWNGYPIAKTSITRNDSVTILKIGGKPSGAQIFYSVTGEAQDPLVKVTLQNINYPKWSLNLMQDFDYVAQECSCFWIDMDDKDELLAKNSNESNISGFMDDLSYQIVFEQQALKGENKTWRSGLFGIVSLESGDKFKEIIADLDKPNIEKAMKLLKGTESQKTPTVKRGSPTRSDWRSRADLSQSLSHVLNTLLIFSGLVLLWA